MRAEAVAGEMRWRIRVAAALLWSQPTYWLAIFPRARQELRRWTAIARQIPDPVLREHALHKLRTEHLTAEGAAAFAILAARSSWRQVVRACVAFEVLYDFLDALAEQPVPDAYANNRRLYKALGAALDPSAPLADYYAFHPRREDGGYLASLVIACRASLVALGAHRSVLPSLRRLAERADEAQALHHTAGQAGTQALMSWAERNRPRGSTLRWWEIAAAAGSPLGVFALVAAASHADTTERDAVLLERAYFPWIAGLSWLLESLVDIGDDLAQGAHSYVAHYATPREAAERLELIARHAAADAARLPRGGRHTVLLAGMASMNLSHEGARCTDAVLAAAAVQRAIGGPVGPLVAVLRLRRRLRSGGEAADR
jgi:tetraprenyl-beta-curcumene synthase